MQPAAQQPNWKDDLSSDRDLVSRIRSGDMRAMETLMRRHNRTLFRTARAILHRVLGLGFVAQDRPRGAEQRAVVPPHEGFHGAHVAAADPRHQVAIRRQVVLPVRLLRGWLHRTPPWIPPLDAYGAGSVSDA